MLGTFFLPLGFDIIFFLIMKLVGSYWITSAIFYLLSASFLGLHFFFSGNNPLIFIKNIFSKKSNNKKQLLLDSYHCKGNCSCDGNCSCGLDCGINCPCKNQTL